MPVNCEGNENPRYRVKTTKTGKKVRLAFCRNKVVEAKNLKTKKTHTMKEFAKDRKRKGKIMGT